MARTTKKTATEDTIIVQASAPAANTALQAAEDMLNKLERAGGSNQTWAAAWFAYKSAR